MRLASIDIGSNAIRLLVNNVFSYNGSVQYQKETLIRVPLRLGREAFNDKVISDEKRTKLIKAMEGYRSMMEVFDVDNYQACATSALRDAANGEEIVNSIRQQSGIDIQIISGQEEAQILYAMDISRQLDPDKPCLYIDVGGGSTEISLFADNRFQESQSFPIGTIRLLSNLVDEEEWDSLKQWLKGIRNRYGDLYAIGSGGNINKLVKMYGKKKKKRMSYSNIVEAYEELSKYTYEERIRLLELKPDRADVILPAASVFKSVMAWAGIKKVYVPTIGLADGLIKQLYEQQHAQHAFEQPWIT